MKYFMKISMKFLMKILMKFLMKVMKFLMKFLMGFLIKFLMKLIFDEICLDEINLIFKSILMKLMLIKQNRDNALQTPIFNNQ